jgi:hypothetical protein
VVILRDENDYLADVICKSGFPLEIEVADILESHGWEVMPSLFYRDRDTNEFNEIDIIAHKTAAGALKGSPNYPYRVTVGLIVECKKREKTAWVFFPRPRDPNDVDYSGVGLAAVDSFRVARISSLLAAHPLEPKHPALRLQAEFDLTPQAFVPAHIARELWAANEQPNFIQARDFHCLSSQEKSLSYDVVRLEKHEQKFDRDSERKLIHGALSGLAKAVDERLVRESEAMQILLKAALDPEYVRLYPHMRQFSISYFFPVIVFYGKLKVWRKGIVSDTSEILHEVILRSRYYFHDTLVSVVAKQGFERWLTQLESNMTAVVNKIVSQREKLDKQVELLERHHITESGQSQKI